MQAFIGDLICPDCGLLLYTFEEPERFITCDTKGCSNFQKKFIPPTVTLKEVNDQTNQQGSEG